MTLTTMKEIARDHGGTIPPGIAMDMTDLEINRAIKAGYLKEPPERMDTANFKKVPAKATRAVAKDKTAKTTKSTGKDKAADAKPGSRKTESAPAGTDGQGKFEIVEGADGQGKLELVERDGHPVAVARPGGGQFTEEERDAYSRLDGIIRDRMQDMQKASFDIAFALHDIYQHSYHKIGGYKDIYGYAKERYGISRGTTNNMINIVDRFGAPDGPGLKPAYAGFSSTQLICMLGHTDTELKDIRPQMSSREIKKALKGKGAKGETVNTLNGGKPAANAPDDDGPAPAVRVTGPVRVIAEMTKEDMPDFIDPEDRADVEAYVCNLLMSKAEDIAGSLLLGHHIRILDIV